MKKQAIFMLVILFWGVFAGCTSSPTSQIHGEIKPGKYIVDDNPISANLKLYDDNTFILTGSALSSAYPPHGTYSIQEDRMVLEYDSRDNIVFAIEEDQLIFESGRWLETWVEIGAIFYFDDQWDGLT